MGAATPEAAPDRREPEPRPTVESRSVRERSTSSSKPAEDLGNRRGEGRVRVAVHLQVLTVDEAVADVKARVDGIPVEHVYTWSTVAEMPEDLATRHRELWLGPVRHALTSG